MYRTCVKMRCAAVKILRFNMVARAGSLQMDTCLGRMEVF